ncbi:MAG: ankyrin repeat domain-containing protein [Chloroflexota bacterium]
MAKPLPVRPSLAYARKRAKKFLKELRDGQPQAVERLQQFHPRFQENRAEILDASHIKLSDAQLVLAREHGLASWTKYVQAISNRQSAIPSHVPHNEQDTLSETHDHNWREKMPQIKISDENFRQALAAIDAGDSAELKRLLHEHPTLVTDRADEDGTYAGAYFTQPMLLHFVAENPIRHGSLPDNIAEIAQLLIDAGADVNAVTGDGTGTTLGLVCSGRVPRESGVVAELISTLVRNGADPEQGVNPALGHSETQALQALVEHGATIDLHVAAALGKTADLPLYLTSHPDQLQNAFMYACLFGQTKAVAWLLDAGAQINAFSSGFNNGTASALHGAVAKEHLPVIRLLLDRGADLTIKDDLFGGTPIGWAEHMKHEAALLLLQDATNGLA